MENIYFGVITVLLCLAGYFYSWKQWTRGNYAPAVGLLMVCGLLLRIYTSTDLYLHAWDERYHALVAKNLMQHPLVPTLYDRPALPFDYRNWAGNHIWVHKQPLPLWAIMSSLYVFGVNAVAVRIPSIILTTIGIWITFRIGSYLSDKNTGYLAAFLYSVNGLIIELTAGRVATDHIDIFFLFFVELAVFLSILFVQRRRAVYNVLAGVSIGAAVLSKWLPALIVLPVWLLVVIDSGQFSGRTVIRQFLLLLLVTAVVFLPWQIYIYTRFPLEARWEASFNLKHILEPLEGRTGPWYYFIDKIRINYGELVYLPLIWFTWKSLKRPLNFKRLAVALWFWVPLLFFSFAKTKMQGYILFAAPALFLMTAEFFVMLRDFRRGHRPRWLYTLVMVLLIALPARYAIERMKPFEKRDRNPQWAVRLKQLGRQHISNGVLLNSNHPIEAMFYTDLTAYENLPEKKVIQDLIAEGHTVVIADKDNVPDGIRTMPGVIFTEEN